MSQLSGFLSFILLLCLAFGWAGSSHAQILNVEKQRLDDDTANIWIGSATLGFRLQQQGNQVLTLSWDNDVAYLSENHNYMFISNIRFIGVEDRDVISTGYVHGRINFLRKQLLSYETFAQTQYDRARGLEERTLVGGGVRWDLSETAKSKLQLGNGIMYEKEVWFVNDGDASGEKTTKKGNFVKSTHYLSFHKDFNKQYSFNTIAYYQAPVAKPLQPRVTAEVNSTARLHKNVSANIGYSMQYDAAPIANVDKLVYILQIGFRFNL